MLLKICGLTRGTDALHAAQHGATALGFVFWRQSPRYVDPARVREIVDSLPAALVTVGVFVNEPIERIRQIVEDAGLQAVQLHGDEPPGYADSLGIPVFRSATVDNADEIARTWAPGTTLLLDAANDARRGGTGKTVDWSRAAAIARERRVVLAGGLTPHNVLDAIAAVQPYGVDVSSGVEEAPGVKDPEKVRQFLANARRAYQHAY